MAATQDRKVTDFFSSKKRSAANPSKRRKVEIRSREYDCMPQEVTNTQQTRNLQNTAKEEDETRTDGRIENALFSPVQTRAARKSKSASISSSVKKPVTRRRKGQIIDRSQKLIPDILSTKTDEVPTVTDDVTLAWDEHDAIPKTPSGSVPASETKSRKRTRGEILQEDTKEATPEKRPQPKDDKKAVRKSKKKLDLAANHVSDIKTEETDDLDSLVIPKSPPPISPLPRTPELKIRTKPEVKMSSAVQAAMEKCAVLTSRSVKTGSTEAEDMKEKLSKVTNLDDLRERLTKLKETKEKLKAPIPSLKKFEDIKIEVEVPSDTKPTVPAYERFHHLATPAAPTLCLPFKYKLLAEQFRGMDTVISMLHNRNEVCTFSKLKVAVQELTKRNFEKNHVGKIKTVYPSAYQFRQEKGLKNPAGLKESGYQLTVEARLEDEMDKKMKPTFKASHLLRRRENFHNSLISVVKHHHKVFLSKLSRPLIIPDDKITRWHPKFSLDEVPDIEESPLPQPPDVQTYQTAQDILDHARGKVMPKVEKALMSTVKEEEKLALKQDNVTKPTVKPVSGALKGIPQSLLEKIRAREAANTVSALMRDPKEEKRTAMIKRLPDIMRIVRSHFVTEKKPSLTLESIITRIQDSYRSEMAIGDIQAHLELCVELLPEWMTVIQIKKGKYYKIDRNIDLQVLTDKINNISKGKK